jgi:hypothetical protein
MILPSAGQFPHRLAGLQHAHDAFLRLGVVEQRAEALALQRHQVLLVTSEPASTSPPHTTSAISVRCGSRAR